MRREINNDDYMILRNKIRQKTYSGEKSLITEVPDVWFAEHFRFDFGPNRDVMLKVGLA